MLPCCLLALAAAPAFADPPIVTGFELTGGSRTLHYLPPAPTYPPPPVGDPEPPHTFACGSRWIRVFGENFDLGDYPGLPDPGEGATIRLTMAGAPDIEAIIHDGGWATMNPEWPEIFIGAVDAEIVIPEGQPGGLYSVQVTNEDGSSATLADVIEVEGFCPRGRAGDLYVAQEWGRDMQPGIMLNGGSSACQDCTPSDCGTCWCNFTGNVLQFDGQTGEFVCLFARSDAIAGAYDLVWGPNGNLFVLSIDQAGTGFDGLGRVVEFDGQTGQELGVFCYNPSGWGNDDYARSLDFGGPDGNLFLLHHGEPFGWVREYDRTTGAFLAERIESNRGFDVADDAWLLRFGPNGHPLLGGDGCYGEWVLFEVDMTDPPGEMDPEDFRLILQASEISSTCASIVGLVYEAATDTLLVLNSGVSGVYRVDFASGTVLETVLLHQVNGLGVLDQAADLAFGPAGNLFVSGTTSDSPFYSDYIPGYPDDGAIHEFDGTTFEQVQFFGYAHYGEMEWAYKPRPDELFRPWRIAFKPLPGDWGGRMAGGDWQVDAWDYDKFVEAYNGGTFNRALDLLAFDFDHDGDIDCDDWAEFQLAWTAGGSPPDFAPCEGYDPDPDGDGVHTDNDVCPDTEPDVTVDAEGRPLGDLNGDCAVDMADFAIFQANMRGPAAP